MGDKNEDRVILEIKITEKSFERKANIQSGTENFLAIGIIDMIKSDLINEYRNNVYEEINNGK